MYEKLTIGVYKQSNYSMATTYGYQFTHHTNPFTTDYKFVVYRVYCPNTYDFMNEFDGQEALNHYQIVLELTPEQLQQYLYLICHESSKQKIFIKQMLDVIR
jgi:hypothetical protein